MTFSRRLSQAKLIQIAIIWSMAGSWPSLVLVCAWTGRRPLQHMKGKTPNCEAFVSGFDGRAFAINKYKEIIVRFMFWKALSAFPDRCVFIRKVSAANLQYLQLRVEGTMVAQTSAGRAENDSFIWKTHKWWSRGSEDALEEQILLAICRKIARISRPEVSRSVHNYEVGDTCRCVQRERRTLTLIRKNSRDMSGTV